MPLGVVCVFGTRPEAIKMAPVVKALQACEARVSTTVIVTAQHREMLDQALRLFEIAPEHDLDVMVPEQTLAELSVAVLRQLDPLLDRLQGDGKADIIVVHGDTPTAFMSGLAAYYRHIPVAHVEAGLRTYDIANPYPEELNRQCIDSLSRWLFAPTPSAKVNLVAERKPNEWITVTGNTGIDALLTVAALERSWDNVRLAAVDFGRRVLLVTAHRRESLGRDMEQMFWAIRDLVESYSDLEVVFPVHLNPKVLRPARAILASHPRVHLLEPLTYGDIVGVLKRAYIVLTDSGGLQEEGPALGKPTLVMRRATERPEGIEEGVARLAGVDRRSIVRETSVLLDDPAAYRRMARRVTLYGDGRAAERIVGTLLHDSGLQTARPADFVPPV